MPECLESEVLHKVRCINTLTFTFYIAVLISLWTEENFVLLTVLCEWILLNTGNGLHDVTVCCEYRVLLARKLCRWSSVTLAATCSGIVSILLKTTFFTNLFFVSDTFVCLTVIIRWHYLHAWWILQICGWLVMWLSWFQLILVEWNRLFKSYVLEHFVFDLVKTILSIV